MENNERTRVIIKVNDTTITEKKLNLAIKRVLFKIDQEGRELNKEQLKEIENSAIKAVIDKKLLLNESKKLNIVVNESEVNEHIIKVKNQFTDQRHFETALNSLNITEEDLKEEIREGIAVERFIDKAIAQNIEVTEKEVKNFYYENPNMFKEPERVKASHILIKFNEEGGKKKSEALKKIEEIRWKILEGGSFEEMAKKFSDCPSSSRGGDLGYFKRSQMVKPFSDSAFSLNQGEISEVVETQFGFHLIKVFDKKHKKTITFEEAKARLFPIVKQKKVWEKTEDYINKLRKEAVIEKIKL